MKRYMNMALLYAVLAMVGGVFYREFTKFNGFTGKTTLGVVHTHYFMLGMVFFLLLLLLEKNFTFTGPKTGRILAVYAKPVSVYDYETLKDDPLIEADTIGLKGSPTNVYKSFSPPVKGVGMMMEGADKATVDKLVSILSDKHIL